MTQRRVLVLGASGLVGNAAVRRFLRDESFDVVAASRRVPAFPARSGFDAARLDLLDRDAVAALVRDQGPITHVAYAALFEKAGDLIGGWTERVQIDTNRQMLANLLDALKAARSPVEHISVLQGTKAYGYHLQQMRIPGKESQARVEHENFYFEQEDLLVEAASDMGFHFTIFRPQFIFGGALGASMNLIPVIGAYAAICAETGRPFTFPGGESYVAEAVDTRLLADALHWAALADAARDETFNVTNGDVFEWRDLWPSFASHFGAETGPDEPMSIATWLPQQQHVWANIVARHGLEQHTLLEMVGQSHEYADDAFAYTPDGDPLESRAGPVLLSTIKLRQAGFHHCIDTEEMFSSWFARLQEHGVLP